MVGLASRGYYHFLYLMNYMHGSGVLAKSKIKKTGPDGTEINLLPYHCKRSTNKNKKMENSIL
ncbi:hypothetical protein Mia14_0930 [Candidatus Mancarchaeum acidiphilum]|uniref:Uncharacterized protein n=1 Tax=Candidatus Mancarchaeum acidiphilum TaxID=1920749 RepID=A0A218NP10_9ARCH|nr:hypothetical protein [Candidatus Mancarchaeum acidiphilum]ASI14203.1 hypothetical protein Mia14_0930 [Candidatus Mancarchaeum acidiphilum]